MSVALAAASVATDCAAGGGSGNGGCGCGIGCGCGGCFRFARRKIAAQRLRAPAITRAAFRVRWAARTLSSRSAARTGAGAAHARRRKRPPRHFLRARGHGQKRKREARRRIRPLLGTGAICLSLCDIASRLPMSHPVRAGFPRPSARGVVGTQNYTPLQPKGWRYSCNQH